MFNLESIKNTYSLTSNASILIVTKSGIFFILCFTLFYSVCVCVDRQILLNFDLFMTEKSLFAIVTMFLYIFTFSFSFTHGMYKF